MDKKSGEWSIPSNSLDKRFHGIGIYLSKSPALYNQVILFMIFKIIMKGEGGRCIFPARYPPKPQIIKA